MIIPEHKLLFVHIPKTGGQSLTEFFLKNILDKPKLNEFDEIDIDSNPELGLKLNTNLKSRGPAFYHHLFLSEYLENKLLPVNNIEQYYKFSVIRNPYDRFLSAYKFLELDKTHKKSIDFAESIQYISNKNSKLYRMFCPQVEYLEPINKINTIFTTEILEQVFEFFRKEFNFAGNSVYRNKSMQNYNTLLDNETKEFIKYFYKKDFDLYYNLKETT